MENGEMRLRDPACPFCLDRLKNRLVAEHGTMWAIEDGYPVTEGHLLIIPKRHSPDWLALTEQETRDADALVRILCRRLALANSRITGFNIGMNCGASAGQTVFHAHIHLIPRRDGDTPNPQGGVRGVIPAKMNYPAA
jgi:diadenosine tetraphosphate (Ap4A) HIT family hydrolase